MKGYLFILLAGVCSSAHAAKQAPSAFEQRLQQRADAAVSLMSFNAVPDLTASNLSITEGNGDRTDLLMSQLGGGATVSSEVPIYLEGNLGYSRYDPAFPELSSNTRERVAVRWNTVSVAGGIGYDFPLSEHWVLRPIVNTVLGTVASDLRVARAVLERVTGAELDFLDNGQMSVYGLGGSLMLDYELFSKPRDVDFELRYSYIQLNSFGDTPKSVEGSSQANNFSLYARRRTPTGFEVMERPLRYVVEGAHTQYFGDQRGMLGFNSLTSLGMGLELDSSKYDILITRTRLVLRYMFGENTNGYSVGFAVSF